MKQLINTYKKDVFVFICIILFPAAVFALQAKYVSAVHSIIFDHDYIRQHKALSYWRISPFYIAQRNETSCSLASITMVVNAARNLNPVLANQALATQTALLKRVNMESWTKGVSPNGEGATLDQLSNYLNIALKKYGISDFSIKAVHVNDRSNESLSHLREELSRLRTGKTFMLVNFNLKYFSNIQSDGHISPIAAYDAKKKQVLIMDVYRRLFEPYWVPDRLLLAAMASKDPESKKNRGYVVLMLK